jgi:hypothetical protein
MSKELIAPCGMNCALCANYLAGDYEVRERGVRMPSCAGCRPRGKMCAYLKKRCELLKKQRVEFCYECPDMPCHELQMIDKRYRERYRMSMIENLRAIRTNGLDAFLKAQAEVWRCVRCGGTISCHNGLCFSCDFEALAAKKSKYRWEGA